jgi:hypothetical protein
MGNHRREKLTRKETASLLARLDHPAVRDECRTCECLQGFIAQLRLDAVAEAGPLLDAYRVDATQVHASLDCERCVPAEVFAEYLVHKRDE